MKALLTVSNAFWLVTFLTEIVLLVVLLRRGFRKTRTVFVFYIAATAAETVVAVCSYWKWGFYSREAAWITWASQGVVICLRFGAVVEVARGMLANYRGLWALAKRILFAVAAAAMVYALIAARHQRSSLILKLDRGLELAIATFALALLLFARYYLLPVRPLDRTLALGFCLYSCFYVINDSLFEQFHIHFINLWGYLDVLTFLATLLMWLYALRAYSPILTAVLQSSPSVDESYGTLSAELNLQLKHLNEQLSQLLHSEDLRP